MMKNPIYFNNQKTKIFGMLEVKLALDFAKEGGLALHILSPQQVEHELIDRYPAIASLYCQNEKLLLSAFEKFSDIHLDEVIIQNAGTEKQCIGISQVMFVQKFRAFTRINETMVNRQLKRLVELQKQSAITEQQKHELINSLIPQEIRDKIAEIDEEFRPRLDSLNNQISKIDEEVRSDVLALGRSVEGEELRVEWVNAQSKWEGKLLDVYAKSHPELLEYKKESAGPSTKIKNVTKG